VEFKNVEASELADIKYFTVSIILNGIQSYKEIKWRTQSKVSWILWEGEKFKRYRESRNIDGYLPEREDKEFESHVLPKELMCKFFGPPDVEFETMTIQIKSEKSFNYGSIVISPIYLYSPLPLK
jgi:hypothetical protein